MQRTILATPVLGRALRVAAAAALRVVGWRVEGRLPDGAAKCVLVAAPHTTNWDMPYALLAAFAVGLNPYWMGKHTIFRRPFGGLMRWLGGIPVRRGETHNLVESSAAALRAADGPLQLIVAPSGTRANTARWRSGFYFIARAAEVPIVLGYIDYAERCVGIGPVFATTGDVDKDMAAMRAWYAPYRGRDLKRFDGT